MKIINKKSLKKNPMLPSLMMNELEILKNSVHMHIMHVIELMEDTNNFYIISEILEGGELFDRILEVDHFSEIDAAFIIE